MSRPVHALAGILAAAVLTSAACTPKDAAPPPEPAPVARIETREFEYSVGTTKLKGFLAFDAARGDRRPGVLVVHEWWGHNEHARAQARRLAEAGYVGLALDMYGDGKITNHPDSAAAFVGEATRDAAALRAKFQAALDQLKQDPQVDSTKVAAIGYCFGGMIVLSEARAGTDLDAVASFHGALPTGAIPPGTVKARILVLTGGADPMVPQAALDRFSGEMTAAGATFEIVSYPGVKHSFTNPDANSHGMDALGYDASADQASWAAMLAMFREVFGG
ncbi:MAG: dienelactone hydrolase family protein [Gemmatimonadetes bacterium]|nr:dienelactone hydrolase family protein [Gemmatimonadota bacterium]